MPRSNIQIPGSNISPPSPPGKPIVADFPTPNLADRIKFVMHDVRLAEFAEPPEKGSAYNGPEADKMTGWTFATRRPADQVGWVQDFYLNERQNQDDYNYTVDYPYPTISAPRLTRSYVYLREDYADLPPPDLSTPDSVFSTLKLVDYKQTRLDDPVLDSVFVGVQKVFETRPIAIVDKAITREFGFGGTLDVDTTIGLPGTVPVEEGINVVESKTTKKGLNTEINETQKIGTPGGYTKITNGGSGYTSNPAVSFTGGTGSGAAATATVGKAIASLNLTNGGGNYTFPPAVVITGGGNGAGEASGIATIAFGLTLLVTNGGKKYSSAPTVSFAGGGGSGAAATAQVGYPIESGTPTAEGSGYTSDPTITSSGGGGTGAVFAAVRGFALDFINLDQAGSGYTSDPTVSLVGGDGTTLALAKAIRSRYLSSVTVNTTGSGYYSVAVVSVVGGGTSDVATVTARMKLTTIDAIVSGGSGYTVGDVLTVSGGTAATAAQLTVSSVSGGVITGVTISTAGDYTVLAGVGHTSMSVTGGTGTGATFTGDYGVLAVDVVTPGSGYESVPTFIVSAPDGSGVTLTAVLTTAGVPLKRIDLINGLGAAAKGMGYTTVPSVTISGGGGTGARATAVLAGTNTAGTVRGITVVNPGSGYTSNPTLSISGGGGTGATATAAKSTTNGVVTGLTLTNAGSGYSTAPTISFSGGSPTKVAKAKALLDVSGSVTSIVIVNPGSKFTSTPTVTLVGGGGSGATATATLASTGSVVDLDLTSQGSYTVAPTVVFSGGGGSGAAATYVVDYWPTLWETTTDPVEGIVVNIRKRIKAAGTKHDPTESFEEITAADKWRSIQIVSSIDLSSLPAPEIIASTHAVSFPDLLLSVEPSWSQAFSTKTHVNTGFSSSNITTQVSADMIVRRLNGYRGIANAVMKRQFFFGIPPMNATPDITLIQPSSGTATITVNNTGNSNAAGTTGGFSYVEIGHDQSISSKVLDINNVLTGGIAALAVSDAITKSTRDNLNEVLTEAYNLGIITGPTNFVSVTSTSQGTFEVSIPDSDPLFLPPLSYILAASTVEKWRFGLYVSTLIYAQIPLYSRTL